MKKILLFFAAAVCAIASWAQGSEVSATVKGQTLEVALTNATEKFVAFQMDIVLPSGVTVDNDGTALALNLERLTENAESPFAGAANANFILVYNVIDPTHVRVLAYNLANRALAGNEGALFTMSFNGTPGGDFTVNNIKFVTETELNEVDLTQIQSTAGASFVPGDVNMDTFVTSDDVVAAVGVFLRGVSGMAYPVNVEAGDLNDVPGIDSGDIVLIVKLYLGI